MRHAGWKGYLTPLLPKKGVKYPSVLPAAQTRTYPKSVADDIIADMSTLELSDEQVISLVRGLPAERKRAALLALAQEAQAGREDRLRWAEAQLRRASAQRGLDWDRLSEDERESFVDALLHEK